MDALHENGDHLPGFEELLFRLKRGIPATEALTATASAATRSTGGGARDVVDGGRCRFNPQNLAAQSEDFGRVRSTSPGRDLFGHPNWCKCKRIVQFPDIDAVTFRSICHGLAAGDTCRQAHNETHRNYCSSSEKNIHTRYSDIPTELEIARSDDPLPHF